MTKALYIINFHHYFTITQRYVKTYDDNYSNSKRYLVAKHTRYATAANVPFLVPTAALYFVQHIAIYNYYFYILGYCMYTTMAIVMYFARFDD